MTVAEWKAWLPGFVSAREGHEPVDLDVHGEG
jgi:hypothetical protein